MTHPCIIERRATSFEEIFPRIDARRLRYLAGLLDEAQFHAAAELARGWASEHEMLADRLAGEKAA